MAKIENTQAYPTVVPAMDDLLIATDVSNNNETVTFLVSSLIGGAGVLQGLQSVLDTGNTATQNINLTGDITVVGTVYPTTITAQATTGVAGQILSSTGTGIQWINSPTTSCCSWQDTLAINDTTTIKASVDGAAFTIFNAGGGLYVNSPAVVNIGGITNFNNTVVDMNNSDVVFGVTGQIEDSTGSTGTNGQFLTSQGPAGGIEWSSTLPPASCCGLQSTISAGSTSTGQNVTLTGTGLWTFDTNVSITSAGTNTWSGNNVFSAAGNLSTTAGIALTGSLYDGASTGTAGQVLTSTATGVQWAAASAGSQDLQSVLDFGNTAGGANANITISGFIRPGQITDTSGSNGAAGQILTSTGTGLAWVTGTCCNLQDTLSVGNSATTSIILSGAGINLTAPTVIPTLIQDALGNTGAAGQVLGLNAGATAIEWVAATGAVSSVTAAAPSTSTGTSLTINPTVGAVVVEPHAYGGTTNVGFVPTGGSATTFLRGDGTWQTPAAGGGVTDLSTNDGALSTGNAITVNAAASGSVTANVFAYAGTSNVGYVPTGGTASTFLRGDGTWQTPAGGTATAPEQVVKVPFYNTKWTPTGSNHYTLPNALGGSYSMGLLNTDLGGLAPSAGGFTVSHSNLLAGTIYGNPGGGDCSLYSEIWQICKVQFQFVTNVNTTFVFQLWKTQICPPDEEIGTLPVVATCEFIEADPSLTNCCSATLASSPATILEYGAGDALFLTLNNAGAGGTNVPFQGNVYITLQKKAP